MKRILLITQHIYPEPFKSSEMAFELVKKGYSVDVLCSIPNYPEGYYYNGYGLFKKRVEKINGVNFYRCFQTYRKLLPRFLGLSLNYMSFVFTSIFWVLFFFIWKKKYNVIIAHAPSPITQVIPACVIGKLKHVPVFSWVQDIWPDSVTSTIGEKGKKIEPILQHITDWIYKNSTKILVTSKGMIDLINRTCDYSEKIVYYPQWSEEMFIENNLVKDMNAPYNIMMAGSINDGIGISSLISLCIEMKNDNVQFTFIGGGGEEENMKKNIEKEQLNNVTFIRRKPLAEMPYYYAQADSMLLSLKETSMSHLKATIPARLQSYMSAGKPILAMIDGSAADVIREANCGYVVPAGDYKSLATYIRNVVLVNRSTFSKKGNNARDFFLRNFTKEKCINNLVNLIEK